MLSGRVLAPFCSGGKASGGKPRILSEFDLSHKPPLYRLCISKYCERLCIGPPKAGIGAAFALTAALE
jgi:hypothetical protein